MAITSLPFALFVIITAIIYFAFPLKNYRWVILLIASSFFYVYNSFRYSAFILISIITIYLAACKIDSINTHTKAFLKTKKEEWSREERKAYKKKSDGKRKALLAATLLLNFGMLFLLKYFNFLSGSIASMLGSSAENAPQIRLLLPLGISFYTFISTGYLIDVYRETVKSERNILKFALFVSFFPQIIQGPISSFEKLSHQLTTPHEAEWLNIKIGCELILWGLFKKLVIADRLFSPIKMVCEDYTSYGGEVILFVSVMYALQLYADFSGGIDIARGVAGCLGIQLDQNFRQPYFSKNISEYWRRWHITLGAWMKKYVFYTLAVSPSFLNISKRISGSSFGKTSAGSHIAKSFPTALSSLIVFILIGIWHGANSKYIGFGLWNGLIIMVSAFLMPVYDYVTAKLHIKTASMIWKLFQMLRTFVVILIGYYFDIAPNYTGALEMMKRSVFDFHMNFNSSLIHSLDLSISDCAVLFYGFIVMLYMSVRLEKTGLETPGHLINKHPAWLQWIAILLGVISVITFGLYGSGMEGTDFVYMGF